MLLDVGFKNYVVNDSIYSVIKPNSAKAKRLINEATLNNKLIDCTQGKKTLTILLLTTRHLVLSSLKYSSIIKRIESGDGSSAEIKIVVEEPSSESMS
jgi:extracellular matrix regulatory protein A